MNRLKGTFYLVALSLGVFLLHSCYPEPCEENPINSVRFSCPVSGVFALNITNAGLYPEIDERDTVESNTYGIRVKLVPNEMLCYRKSWPFFNSAYAYSLHDDCILPDDRRGPVFRFSIKNRFSIDNIDTAMTEQSLFFIRRTEKNYENVMVNRMTTFEHYDFILNKDFSKSVNQQFIVRVDLSDTVYYDTTQLVYLKQ